MEKRKIFFYADNYDAEYASTMGGLKPCVVVQSNDKFYRVIIFTLKRLTYTYRKIVKENGVYDTILSGIVLVKRASKKRIIETILSLSNNFFDGLKPLTLEELDNLSSAFGPKLAQPFSEWVQVYPIEFQK